METHKKDLRLSVNAGMDYPVCKAGEALLDIEFREPVTNEHRDVTCEKCKGEWNRRYPWAKIKWWATI